tara:strand:- start:7 stop:207 length:201 start_codon:yes stop_codon:yes gene_type:complete
LTIIFVCTLAAAFQFYFNNRPSSELQDPLSSQHLNAIASLNDGLTVFGEISLTAGKGQNPELLFYL